MSLETALAIAGIVLSIVFFILSVVIVMYQNRLIRWNDERELRLAISTKNKTLKTLTAEYEEAQHYYQDRQDLYLFLAYLAFLLFSGVFLVMYTVAVGLAISLLLLNTQPVVLTIRSASVDFARVVLYAWAVFVIISMLGVSLLGRYSIERLRRIIARVRTFPRYEKETLARIELLKKAIPPA